MRPAAGALVRIPSHPKICSVNMRVRAVVADDIAGSKTLRHLDAMLLETVHSHRAGDRFKAFLSQLQLIAQPRRWNNATPVGVRKPKLLQRTLVASEDGVRGQPARGSDARCVSLQDGIMRS